MITKNIKHSINIVKVALLTFVTIAIVGCSNDFKHPDTSNIDIDIKVRPFYKDMFGPYDDINSHIVKLDSAYGVFFTDLCRHELRIGIPSEETFAENFKHFLSYEENDDVIASCDSIWDNLDDINEKLTDGMKCMKYYFPNIGTPQILTHFSGFNSKIVVDSTYISFSLEHYLGSDCRYYTWLEIPQYARMTKSAEYIVPDVIRAWIYANLPDMSEKDDVLTAMIYQGKVLYATKSCLPDMSLEDIMGYNKEQMTWCQNAESEMWGFMIEEKLLYSTNPLDKNKIINDAPYTAFFGQQSPGRAALWCGFNIIKKYLENNPDVSLAELFEIDNAQQILIGAQYQP